MRSNSIRLAAALLLALLDSGMAAAQKMFVLEKDSIPQVEVKYNQDIGHCIPAK